MKNIFINMKNNSITDESGEPVKSTMLFALENNATYVHIDYTECGVDTWLKVVDFETAEGTKYQFRLNEDLIITIPLPNTLMKEGRLKINPFALKTDVTGNVLRYSGFTYSLTVGSVVDAFDQEFEIIPDIITQLEEKKADKSDTYRKEEVFNKDEIDQMLAGDSVDLGDYYKKHEVDALDNDVKTSTLADAFVMDEEVKSTLRGEIPKAATSLDVYEAVDNSKYISPVTALNAIRNHGVMSTGDVKIILSNTEPSPEEFTTIIWIDTSS